MARKFKVGDHVLFTPENYEQIKRTFVGRVRDFCPNVRKYAIMIFGYGHNSFFISSKNLKKLGVPKWEKR